MLLRKASLNAENLSCDYAKLEIKISVLDFINFHEAYKRKTTKIEREFCDQKWFPLNPLFLNLYLIFFEKNYCRNIYSGRIQLDSTTSIL